jgi:hypothetical protein
MPLLFLLLAGLGVALLAREAAAAEPAAPRRPSTVGSTTDSSGEGEGDAGTGIIGGTIEAVVATITLVEQAGHSVEAWDRSVRRWLSQGGADEFIRAGMHEFDIMGEVFALFGPPPSSFVTSDPKPGIFQAIVVRMASIQQQDEAELLAAQPLQAAEATHGTKRNGSSV